MPCKDYRILKDVDPTLSFKEYQKIYNKKYYEANKEKYFKPSGMKNGVHGKNEKLTEEEQLIREQQRKICKYCNKIYHYSKWKHEQTKACKLKQDEQLLKEKLSI